MKIPGITATLGAALALALLVAPPAHAQLGVAGGLNFNDMNDIELGSTDATLENSTGFHFGAFVNLGAGALSLRPGVYYHRIGTYDFPTGDELEMSAVEVPIDVRLTFAPQSPVAVYVLGGPVLTFPRSGEFDEAVRDVSVTADVGVGFDLGLPGGGFALQPELRYSIGLTDYFEENFTIGGSTITPADDDRRVSELMLRLNLVF